MLDEPASAVVEQVDSAVSDSHVVEDSSTQDKGPAAFDMGRALRDDGVVDVGAGADGMTLTEMRVIWVCRLYAV